MAYSGKTVLEFVQMVLPLTGCYKGVTSRIKHIAHENIITTHCFIHKEQLASKGMSTELNEVMMISVVLNSLHKYKTKIVIDEIRPGCANRAVATIDFPITSFYAVTAYQSDEELVMFGRLLFSIIPSWGCFGFYLEKLSKEGTVSMVERKILPRENVTVPKLNNKNADSLISKLEAEVLPEYRLMSLDIVSMYPSIKKETIIHVYVINGRYYRQRDGISIGSVIGPKLAEIVMINIDKILSRLGGIVFLARYVDDIFIIYNSKITSSEKILKKANEINEYIKFTYENEIFDKLNYLDITIVRFKDHLVYNKYEKPCNANKVINFKSYCPISQKRNIYLMEISKIFSRTNRINKRDEEIKKVNRKYLLNDYPGRLLKNWYDKYLESRFQVKKKQEINTLFGLICGLIWTYKDKELLEEGVIYRLQCTCGIPNYYVGETKTKLKVRMWEHLAAVVLNSLHKYKTKIVIEEIRLGCANRTVATIDFPITTFYAVTAYQSDEVKKLKIKHNPHAKSFNDPRRRAWEAYTYQNDTGMPYIFDWNDRSGVCNPQHSPSNFTNEE
ncbi:uncharacterized protein LOC111628940 [Centruroides sculpturatus]|uniref:uncharacterized protein LOC111628940 n=1 Tax=Centruroides sculpturatus TaxID=218467 RepID=UPI000C6E25DF|nr:uncharacterized protein LOC111628940 [Centruroides sculpturatus]